MKSRILTCITTITSFAALAATTRLAAQEQQKNKQQPRYELIDIGTFGGPDSFVPAWQQIVNGRGTLVGQADTPTPDPYSPNCFNNDCYVSHAFQWQRGVLTDLGTLPGGYSSTAGWITAGGLIIGGAQNGLVDPLTGGPEARAVLWENGSIIDLGTLGGNESASIGANDRGQVIGVASNAIPDPFSFFGATQARAFLWADGKMRDLGTLGGPDAFGQYVNDRGQVTGFSYTSYTPNPSSGVPTVDPFLWENGKMLDLGSLGAPSVRSMTSTTEAKSSAHRTWRAMSMCTGSYGPVEYSGTWVPLEGITERRTGSMTPGKLPAQRISRGIKSTMAFYGRTACSQISGPWAAMLAAGGEALIRAGRSWADRRTAAPSCTHFCGGTADP